MDNPYARMPLHAVHHQSFAPQQQYIRDADRIEKDMHPKYMPVEDHFRHVNNVQQHVTPIGQLQHHPVTPINKALFPKSKLDQLFRNSKIYTFSSDVQQAVRDNFQPARQPSVNESRYHHVNHNRIDNNLSSDGHRPSDHHHQHPSDHRHQHPSDHHHLLPNEHSVSQHHHRLRDSTVAGGQTEITCLDVHNHVQSCIVCKQVYKKNIPWILLTVIMGLLILCIVLIMKLTKKC